MARTLYCRLVSSAYYRLVLFLWQALEKVLFKYKVGTVAAQSCLPHLVNLILGGRQCF